MQFSGTPLEYKIPPPVLGQHTDEVLKSIGYDAAKIEELREKKII